CPPGRRANRCNRCFVLTRGYSATTATRSMLFRPKPATSNGRSDAAGMRNGMRTARNRSRTLRLDSIDLRLSLAYSAFGLVGRSVDSTESAMLPLTKRQREILDYLNEFISQHGYAPSLEEIGRRFGLSSLATVHKHLTNLQEKGFIKRAWNRSRSVEMM